MRTSCKEAAQLTRLIEATGHIDDLVDVEGAEQDLADQAQQIPVPTSIPRFAETVDLFKTELSKRQKRTPAQMQQLAELSTQIREQASQFLVGSMAECLIGAQEPEFIKLVQERYP